MKKNQIYLKIKNNREKTKYVEIYEPSLTLFNL